ncbi:MAG: hypothetical protein AB8G23_22740 [Myxococcota bacterium]
MVAWRVTEAGITDLLPPGSLDEAKEISVDFIVAGSSTLGLGHVMRSAALCEAAIQRAHPVRVFFDGDDNARSVWQVASPRTPTKNIRPWSSYEEPPSAHVAFLDFPSEKDEWLQQIKRRGALSVVLDDPRSIPLANCTINPALHHGLDEDSLQRSASEQSPAPAEPAAPAVRQSNLLEGPAYSILAEAHRETTAPPWPLRNELLLSIGGADPHHATPRLAAILDRLEQETSALSVFREKHAVLGAAYADAEGSTQETLRRGGWQVHRSLPPKTMARRMQNARLAIMGFGTSLTELAWHGTPHLSVTHHRFDDVHAERLERHGVGRHLGYAPDLDAEHVETILRASLSDGPWQQSSANLAHTMLAGGRGVERILDHLLCMVHDAESRAAV